MKLVQCQSTDAMFRLYCIYSNYKMSAGIKDHNNALKVEIYNVEK